MTKNLIKRTNSKPIKKKQTNKGKLSKKAETFLQICKERFGFEPAREFINHYAGEVEMYQELYERYKNPEVRLLMTPEEKKDFWKLHREIKNSLELFMKFSYPQLRAVDVKGDMGTRPIFNINLGAPADMKSANPVIDVTRGKVNGT